MGRRAATKGSANFKRDSEVILGRPLETRRVGKLFQRQDLFSALSIDDPCRIVDDTGLFAFVSLGSALAVRTAFDIGQAVRGRSEIRLLLLAMGAPVRSVHFCARLV
jgi:hypothetical protein